MMIFNLPYCFKQPCCGVIESESKQEDVFLKLVNEGISKEKQKIHRPRWHPTRVTQQAAALIKPNYVILDPV